MFFSTAQNSFWTRQFWCFLVLLPFFVSTLPHKQNISLWGLFSSRETKKVTQGKIRWLGRVGHRGQAIFSQKLLNTQCSLGRWAHKSTIMKWANMAKESSEKKSLKLNAASHNNPSGYTVTDGFLEYSPSRGNLYYEWPALLKITLFFLGSLLIFHL